MFGLSEKEEKILRNLSTPQKIQDFLDRLPMNHEKQGDTYMSPRRVLRERKAHCIEAALVAATALWIQGKKPLLLDLTSREDDDDHVVALFQQNGYWGAISKTNHIVLRYRDPIYRTIRELALSYYHEYFLNKNGEKTLVSYSRPLDLTRFGTGWIIEEADLWSIADALDSSRHYPLVPKVNERFIRRATVTERKGGEIVEWYIDDPRT
ncbi:MAG: hypothetical protein AAB519_00515 [Patescibacteria group bacterium]